MEGKIIILGSGGSMGVPQIGCRCGVCLSTELKNKRLRSSALLKMGGKTILIDASPDTRERFLALKIDHVDGVLLTHYHEDHTCGLNELRPLFGERPIPLVMSQVTADMVTVRFRYLIDRFDLQILEGEQGEITLEKIPIKFYTYKQQDVPVNGYRIGDFAYFTDIKEYSNEIISSLKGISTIVVGAIHERGSHMHFSLEEALAFARKLEPKRCFLTHISHEMEHETASKNLPSWAELAYDGCEIDVRSK